MASVAAWWWQAMADLPEVSGPNPGLVISGYHIHPDEGWLAFKVAVLREEHRHRLYAANEYLRRNLGLIGSARRLYGLLANVQPSDRPPVFPGLEVGPHILGAGAVDGLTLAFRGRRWRR